MKLRGGLLFFPKCYCKKRKPFLLFLSLPLPPVFYLFIYLFLDLCVSTLCLLRASAPLLGSLWGRGRELQMPLCEHMNSRSRHQCLIGGWGATVGGETSLRLHRNCHTVSCFASRHEGNPLAHSSHSHPTWLLATLLKTVSPPRTRACFAKCRMLPPPGPAGDLVELTDPRPQ